jgi:acyl-CoA thioester hydrolase
MSSTRHAHTSSTHILPYTVQIFDTDCYGVMWHGAYAKWLEMGRVLLLQGLGVEMPPPGTGDIFPVTEQTLRYKQSAKMQQKLEILTTAVVDGAKLLFTQIIRDAHTQHTVIEAQTTCVVLDTDWKLYRRVPNYIQQALLDSQKE